MISTFKPESLSQQVGPEKTGVIAIHKYLSVNRNCTTKLLTPLLMSIGLSACGSMYFHSDGDQKLIDEAQKGFASAKTAQIAALDVRSGLVATEIARQRQAVIKDELALRDNQIALLLDKKKDIQQEAVLNNLRQRMTAIVGDNNADGVFNDPENIRAVLINTEDRSRYVQRSRQNVLQHARNNNISIPNDDVESYCSPPKDSVDSRMSIVCDSFRRALAGDKITTQHLEKSRSVVFAKPVRIQGELGTVIKALAQTNKLVTAQEQVVKATKTSLKDAKSYYECQLEADKKEGVDDSLQKAADIITRFADPPGKKLIRLQDLRRYR